MQLITHDITDNTYSISIVPRYFDYEISGTIRSKTNNTSTDHTYTCDILNGKMIVDLADFVPVEDEKYELTLYGDIAGVMWLGQIMYTTKDIQDYQMHSTDENNLKF